MVNEEEKKLRQELANHLGVDFLSPDEIDGEVTEAMEAPAESPKPVSLKPVVKEHAVPVSEIITRCNEQGAKMSQKNPNRFLLYMCATALRQLTSMLDLRDREIAELRKKYEPE